MHKQLESKPDDAINTTIPKTPEIKTPEMKTHSNTPASSSNTLMPFGVNQIPPLPKSQEKPQEESQEKSQEKTPLRYKLDEETEIKYDENGSIIK